MTAERCPSCGSAIDAAARSRMVRDAHLRRAWALVEPDRPSDRARAEAVAAALAAFLVSPHARALAPSARWSELRRALWHAVHSAGGELPALGWRQLARICTDDGVS